MKNIFYIIFISLFSLTIISCSEKDENTTTTDTTAPVIAEQGLSLSTVVTTLAGTGSSGSANGTGTSASFKNPSGVTTDGTNLYVGEYGNHLIRKIE